MTPRRYLAFDIETAKVIEEPVTDILAHRPLGICCAAAVAADRDGATTWHGRTTSGNPAPRMSREEVQAMVRALAGFAAEGYTLLTWNGLAFDFSIVAEESGLQEECARLARGHVDMMFHAVCVLGHFIGLQKASAGMGLAGKLAGMSGAEAPAAWAAGRHEEVLEYVARDVRATLDLALACEARGELVWLARSGRPSTMPLPGGWLDVEACAALPLPDTSWMRDPPKREAMMAWMDDTPGSPG